MWVYKYKDRNHNKTKGVQAKPKALIPGADFVCCKKCGEEMLVLRDKERFNRGGLQMSKSFYGYRPKSLHECGCGLLQVEVINRALYIYTDNTDQVSIHTYTRSGLKIRLAHRLSDMPTYSAPKVDSFKRKSKAHRWKLQDLTHINMGQYTPLERLSVLPSPTIDRAHFLRQYAHTYQIVIFEAGYVYLPDGRRVPDTRKVRRNDHDLTHEIEEYWPRKDLRVYPENLITNLHVKHIDKLRLELEELEDPHHIASLTKPYCKTLRNP